MSKFKRTLVYLLTVLIAMPVSLIIGSASSASAANVGPIVYDSTAVSIAGTWQTSGTEKYTSGSQPTAYIEKDISADVQANPGVYTVEASWKVWSDHAVNAIYQIEDSAVITATVAGINQQLLANAGSAANGANSGYYKLGDFNFTGSGSKIRLSGLSSDNGNVSFMSFRISHINVAPSTPLLTLPANNAYINSASQILTWQPAVDTDEVPSTLNYDVVVDGAVKANTTGLNYSLDLSAMSEDAHTWAVVAKDGTDTVTSENRNFTIDRTDPVINSVTGTAGTTGDLATIAVNATDTNPTSAKISFDGGANWNSMSGAAGSFAYSYSIPSNSVASIPFIVEVADGAGNFDAEVSSITVTDDDAPVIAYPISIVPTNTGETANISINATDNIGITSATINFNGAGYVPLNGSAPNYSYPYYLPTNTLETVTFTVQFSDAAGLTATSLTQTIVPRDSIQPNISTVTGTAGNTGGTTKVTVTATDNIAPTRAEINYGDGWKAMSGNASPFTYNVAIPLNLTAPISYSVKVYDTANNSSEAGPYTITVTDSVKPVGSIKINSDDTYTNNSSVTLNISATDNIGVTEMSFRNGTSGIWSAWEPYTTSKVWNLTAGDGVNTVQVRFRDAKPNTSSNYQDSITLDTVAPTTPGVPTPNVSNPTNLTTHIWNWLASSDSLSGLKGYWTRITGSLNFASTFWGDITSLSTINFPEGIYNFFVSAEDNASNVSNESTYTLIVDTTAPTSTLNPAAVNPTTDNDIDCTGFATDPSNTYVAGVDYRIDEGSWTAATAGDGLFDEAIEAFSFSAGVLADGSHKIEVRAYDAAGNYQTSYPSDTVVIDTTVPVTTDDIDGLWHNNSVTVTLNCADGPGTGCVNTYYSVAGLPFVAGNTFSLTDEGIYTVKYYSVDGVGNKETEKTAVFKVKIDKTVPTDPAANPVAGSYLKAQNVVLSSNDSYSGIDEIWYTTDGTVPSRTNGTLFSGSILVDDDVTIKAIAYDMAENESKVSEFTYEIAPIIKTEATVRSFDTDSATIVWTTKYPATSRVVYDTVSHADISGASAPNYGYAYSTVATGTKVTDHSVSITGLKAGVKYYFRAISSGSPETVGSEVSFETKPATVAEVAPVVIASAAGPAIASRSAQVSTTVTTPAATTDNAAKIDEQGKIKGEDDAAEEEDSINWTPWIILFILIILAGAATGGYFYWFGGDDEKAQTVVRKPEVKEPVAKVETKKPAAKTATSKKKSRRW